MSDSPKLRIILGFATIYLIWGSTYLAIRFAVDTIPPFTLAGARFLLGGAALYGWALYRGSGRPQLRHWLYTLIIGLLMAVGGNGFVTWGEMTVPSGLAALIVSLVPFWIVLIDWLRPGGVRPNRWVIVGVLMGFVGMIFLINPTDLGGVAEIDKTGAAIIVLATMLWAMGSIYSRHAPQPDSHALSAGMQMLGGGTVLMLMGAFTNEWQALSIDTMSTQSVLSVLYLASFGTFAYGVYLWLMKTVPAAKVATYAYVNPVIALFLGHILAGEAVSDRTLVCSAIIIIAVLMVVKAKPARKEIGTQDQRVDTAAVDAEPCCDST